MELIENKIVISKVIPAIAEKTEEESWDYDEICLALERAEANKKKYTGLVKQYKDMKKYFEYNYVEPVIEEVVIEPTVEPTIELIVEPEVI